MELLYVRILSPFQDIYLCLPANISYFSYVITMSVCRMLSYGMLRRCVTQRASVAT
jgi:hypothetical protein